MTEFDVVFKHLVHTFPDDFARFVLQEDNVEVLEVVDPEPQQPEEREMTDIDLVVKRLIHTYPDDFARFTLQKDDVKVVEILDTEHPIVKEQLPNRLIRVRIDGEEKLVHLEFQTADSTDRPMPRRMVGYMGWCIENYDLEIDSTVIYLRPDAGRTDPGYFFQECYGCCIHVQYGVLRLIDIDGQGILDAGQPGLIPVTPLMQRPAGMDAEAWLRQCVNQAQAVPMDATCKTDYLAGLAVLSGLVYSLETIKTLISEETMYESSVVQHFIEQGGRERAIEDLLEVLEIRFGLAAADPLAARIGTIDDGQSLKQLHRAAIQVSSLEAFKDLLAAAAE